MLSIYAALLGTGCPMREIERTDLHRYLQVLAYSAGRKGQKAQPKDEKVTELRRGTIDDFW